MSELKRIVVIHDSIDARGGATWLACLSAKQYKAMGFDTVYITGSTDNGSLRSAGVETIGMNQKRLLSQGKMQALIRGLHNHQSASTISEWIKNNDTPETGYHLHNWAQVLSPSVFSALAPVADRTIVSCHDYFNVCPNGGLLNYGANKACVLKPMSLQCWLSQCDRRSGLHKYWRMLRQTNLNRLAQFSNSKMTFISLHNGMTELMKSIGFKAQYMDSNPNPATAWTDSRVECEANAAFLYVGRLSHEKGADIALKAAKQAGAPIIMVGEGDLQAELKSEYADATFAGFCDRAGIREHANRARAIIVPSRVPEPYGLVVAEAALSGIPILIAEHCLLAKNVCAKEMGDAFDPNQIDTLTQRIEAWSSDDALIKSMSQNACTHASVICSTPEQWISRFIAILQQKLQVEDSKEGERT